MSIESKLDLDDLAHGHPVAERELAGLRERLERAEGVLRRIANGCADTHTPQQHAASYFRALSPSSGKVPEPFEEWHARECPWFVHHLTPVPCDGDDRRVHSGRNCRQVYESEKVPAAPGADNPVREEAGALATPERASPVGTDSPGDAAIAAAVELAESEIDYDNVINGLPCECRNPGDDADECAACKAALRANKRYHAAIEKYRTLRTGSPS